MHSWREEEMPEMEAARTRGEDDPVGQAPREEHHLSHQGASGEPGVQVPEVS